MTAIAKCPSAMPEVNKNRRQPLIVLPVGGFVSSMPEGPSYHQAIGAQTGDAFAFFK